MTNSGDAAEQIVRMSLEGVEVAAKITGTAAKEIAMFLVAALKSNNKNGKLKLKGKERMASMLKSGKALEVFSVKESDLAKFAQGAKQYGIVYCVLRNRKNTPDGLCDIMVKADDAPKISRVVERFKFATVDKAKIESEIVKGKEEKAQGEQAQTDTGQPTPDKTIPKNYLMICSAKRRVRPYPTHRNPKKRMWRKQFRPKTPRRKIPILQRTALFFKKDGKPIRPNLPQRAETNPQGVLRVSRL